MKNGVVNMKFEKHLIVVWILTILIITLCYITLCCIVYVETKNSVTGSLKIEYIVEEPKFVLSSEELLNMDIELSFLADGTPLEDSFFYAEQKVNGVEVTIIKEMTDLMINLKVNSYEDIVKELNKSLVLDNVVNTFTALYPKVESYTFKIYNDEDSLIKEVSYLNKTIFRR